MWSKFHWLTIRVKVREEGGRGVNIWIPPLSLHTLRGAILNFDGITGMIGGRVGRVSRAGADAAQKALAVLCDEGLDVDVNVKTEDAVRVRVRMA